MEAKVSLKDLRFYAFHGIYPDEKKAGNWFIVNMDVFFELEDPSDINQTVDYTALFELVKHHMATPEGLMELLAKKIIDASKALFPCIATVKISIEKEKPPIPSIIGRTAIELTETF